MTLTLIPRIESAGLTDGALFVDGKWRESNSGGTWSHHHPATGEVIGSFAEADENDVRSAVAAARSTFDDGRWARMRAGERAKLLHRYAELLRANAQNLRELLALDNGVPLSFGGIYAGSVDVAADAFDHHAGWIDKLGGETLPAYQGGEHVAMTFREPVGVVAAILPWNAPFLLYAQKVAPALATGCTVVLKPSEYATFAVLRMVELLQEAGLPDGVLNVVTGRGETVGEALITDPEVDKITFTGSRRVGQRIIEASAKSFARVSLELGGKSPAVVFADAPDVGLAAMTTMGTVTMGLNGQACVAQTRALVHRDVYEQFIASAQMFAGMVSYGDPFEPGTMSAPLINEKQLDRVTGLIDRATSDGARLVCGGERMQGDLANGNFVSPALFADVDNHSELAREEVFGPVLAVIPFSTEEEALDLANDTEYGLGATVFTTDLKRAFRVSRGIRAGHIGVNGYQVEPNTPFGGFKTSGIGREGGRGSIEAFTELKTVLIPTGDELM
ncbi:MAG: aldehyde dehydrogenase family protein [Rhodococcus sp. (in: high G+C Gram-positive bacteria)]